jgi:peptide subunit release factor 1 (eRF1)
MNEMSFVRELQKISAAEGPFVSLYLNTEAREETGGEQLQLRWRNFAERIQERVPKAEEAIAAIVKGSHRQGDGLAVITSGDEILFRRYLRRPIEDSISVGPLPNLLPLIEWGQENPRHLLVLADRTGADIYVIHPDRESEHEVVEGDEPDIGRTSRGGWSQPRYQRGHIKAWRDNAEIVAVELIKLIDNESPRLVLIAGDVEALHLLRQHLPEDLRYAFHEIDGSRQLRLEDVEDDLDKAIAAYVGQTTEQLLEKFQEERGQQDLASDGKFATLTALRMAQVDKLLISTDGVRGEIWFSRSNRAQSAFERETLEEIGLDDLEQTTATDVLVMAAIASGAQVCVIPALSEAHGPKESVGALLRFATS